MTGLPARRVACDVCGLVYETAIYRTSSNACSLTCRVSAGVDRRGADECWPWKHFVETDGYGRFKFGSERLRSHRAAYELAKGPIPPGMVVMRSCDNPLCCNPAHLSVGTFPDNTADMDRKGRRVTLRGEQTKMAVLTEDAVRFIRSSSMRVDDLAERFGVNPQCIYKVRQRIRWKHVADA